MSASLFRRLNVERFLPFFQKVTFSSPFIIRRRFARRLRVAAMKTSRAANGWYFTQLGGFDQSAFTAEAAGANVRQIADASIEYVFPQAGTDPLGLGALRQSVLLDTRNAANNTDPQRCYSYSRDGGVSPDAAVTNSFNPFLGCPNQNKMGYYITIISDDTGGNVAYCATFNQEEDITSASLL